MGRFCVWNILTFVMWCLISPYPLKKNSHQLLKRETCLAVCSAWLGGEWTAAEGQLLGLVQDREMFLEENLQVEQASKKQYL